MQRGVLRLQMVRDTDSITLLRGQENVALLCLVTHQEGCRPTALSVSVTLAGNPRQRTFSRKKDSNPLMLSHVNEMIASKDPFSSINSLSSFISYCDFFFWVRFSKILFACSCWWRMFRHIQMCCLMVCFDPGISFNLAHVFWPTQLSHICEPCHFNPIL